MAMLAKFPGKCSTCGGRIDVGTSIDWQKGQGARHADAAVCRAALAAGATATPVQAPVQAPTSTVQAAIQAPALAGLGRPETPAFDLRQPGEGWSAYGRRALLFVLAHDVTFMLDDAALEAGADAVNHAAGTPGVAVEALPRLTATQALLRGLLKARRAAAAPAAPAPAQDGPPAAQAAPGATNGGGGSKVPRPTPPTPQAPPAARVPVPVGAARGTAGRPAALAGFPAVADPF